MAVHQCKFTTRGGVRDFGIRPAPVQLDHAPERIIGRPDAVDCDRPAFRVPGVGVQEVICDVPIGIVGRGRRPNGRHAIRCGRVGRAETAVPALVNVSESVEAESLRPDRAAVRARNAGQVVMGVIAGLRVGIIERIGYAQTSQRAVWVPGKRSDYGLRAHVEFVLCHSSGVGVGVESIRVARTEADRRLRRRTIQIVGGARDRVRVLCGARAHTAGPALAICSVGERGQAGEAGQRAT